MKGGKVTYCLFPAPGSHPPLKRVPCSRPAPSLVHWNATSSRKLIRPPTDCKALEVRLAQEPGAPLLSTWVHLGGTGGCPVSPFAASGCEVLVEAGSSQTLSQLFIHPPGWDLCLAVVTVLRDLL